MWHSHLKHSQSETGVKERFHCILIHLDWNYVQKEEISLNHLELHRRPQGSTCTQQHLKSSCRNCRVQSRVSSFSQQSPAELGWLQQTRLLQPQGPLRDRGLKSHSLLHTLFFCQAKQTAGLHINTLPLKQEERYFMPQYSLWEWRDGNTVVLHGPTVLKAETEFTVHGE